MTVDRSEGFLYIFIALEFTQLWLNYLIFNITYSLRNSKVKSTVPLSMNYRYFFLQLPDYSAVIELFTYFQFLDTNRILRIDS